MGKITFDHNAKTYELRPRKITGALLDAIEPTLEKMRNIGQAEAIREAFADRPEILATVQMVNGELVFDDELTPRDVQRMLANNPKLARALFAPTVGLQTTREGRAVLFELIAKTADRGAFPTELCEALDTPYEAKPAKTRNVETVDSEGNTTTAVVEDDPAVEVSEFWRDFDLSVAIEYAEFFCSRARL